MEALNLFFFLQNYDVTLNIFLVFIGWLYLVFTKKLSIAKRVCFIFGLILYYFCYGSPFRLYSHELFSMHMLQMSLGYFVFPLFLILGLPNNFIEKFIKSKIGFLTKPIFSLFFFNILISFYHVPFIFDFIMAKKTLHFFIHLVLLFAAFCMFLPIIFNFKNKLKPIHKVLLVFANGMLLTPVCAIITFTDMLLFKTYSKASTIMPNLNPLYDQQLGGVLMKIIQEFVYIFLLGYIFLKWFKLQREKDNEEMRKINEKT